MKGTLLKTEKGWQVLFTYREDNHFSPHWSNYLPLHPDVSKFWSDEDAEFYNGKETEFEIVTENNQKYARFFHKFTKEPILKAKKNNHSERKIK